ncbi:C-type cyclin (Fic1) [Cordyceps militaris]|uniref:C-type cyclin (Fic1) n=1 Tax=Cordyceps militaris TaxID=73501 RepID=A0A2H4SH25_CORMI|nr:C-type cyclin (Fic1) [Cordyceps militaris]
MEPQAALAARVTQAPAVCTYLGTFWADYSAASAWKQTHKGSLPRTLSRKSSPFLGRCDMVGLAGSATRRSHGNMEGSTLQFVALENRFVPIIGGVFLAHRQQRQSKQAPSHAIGRHPRSRQAPIGSVIHFQPTPYMPTQTTLS